MKRLILFLIRRKLKLKKYECFQFVKQYSPCDYYYIDGNLVVKVHPYENGAIKVSKSNVSINWLMDDNCEIRKLGVKYEQNH